MPILPPHSCTEQEGSPRVLGLPVFRGARHPLSPRVPAGGSSAGAALRALRDPHRVLLQPLQQLLLDGVVQLGSNQGFLLRSTEQRREAEGRRGQRQWQEVTRSSPYLSPVLAPLDLPAQRDELPPAGNSSPGNLTASGSNGQQLQHSKGGCSVWNVLGAV